MRTQAEIDEMANCISEAIDAECSPFNQGLKAAFDWLLGDDDAIDLGE